MKKIALLLAAALAAAALCGCAGEPNPVEGQASPSPEMAEDVIHSTPEPTQDPVPAACRAAQQEIEEFLGDRTFSDMTEEEVASYMEKLQNQFVGWGRKDGQGNGYILIQPVDGWSEDVSYGEYEISGPEETYLGVERFEGGERVETFEVHGVKSLTLGDAGAGYGFLVFGDDDALMFATFPGYRINAQVAKELGLLVDPPQGDYLMVSVYNDAVRQKMGYAAPAGFYLSLTEEQAQEAKALIAQAQEVDGEKVREETAKSEQGELYRTGVNLYLDGEHYWLFSQDYAGHSLFPGLYCPGLCAWAEEVLGMDLCGFSMTWFEKELASATLQWGEKTQTVTEPEKLEKLSELFQNADVDQDGKCPMTAPLTLEATDGETLTVWIATDSCGTALIEGQVWCQYGDQEDMKAIFDQLPIGEWEEN